MVVVWYFGSVDIISLLISDGKLWIITQSKLQVIGCICIVVEQFKRGFNHTSGRDFWKFYEIWFKSYQWKNHVSFQSNFLNVFILENQ